jgi:hypothetical protein
MRRGGTVWLYASTRENSREESVKEEPVAAQAGTLAPPGEGTNRKSGPNGTRSKLAVPPPTHCHLQELLACPKPINLLE